VGYNFVTKKYLNMLRTAAIWRPAITVTICFQLWSKNLATAKLKMTVMWKRMWDG